MRRDIRTQYKPWDRVYTPHLTGGLNQRLHQLGRERRNAPPRPQNHDSRYTLHLLFSDYNGNGCMPVHPNGTGLENEVNVVPDNYVNRVNAPEKSGFFTKAAAAASLAGFLATGCGGGRSIHPIIQQIVAELTGPPYSQFRSKEVDPTQEPPPIKIVFNLGEQVGEPSAADLFYVIGPLSAAHDFVYRTREVKEARKILCEGRGLENALRDSGITADNYKLATLLYVAECRPKELTIFENEIAQNPHPPHPQIVISNSLENLTQNHVNAFLKNLTLQLDGKIPYTLEDGTKGYYKAQFYVDNWFSPGIKRVLLKIGDTIIVVGIILPAAGLGPFHHKSKASPAPAASTTQSAPAAGGGGIPPGGLGIGLK